jgi:hypothetical protein
VIKLWKTIFPESDEVSLDILAAKMLFLSTSGVKVAIFLVTLIKAIGG